jgi:hypothetical protein
VSLPLLFFILRLQLAIGQSQPIDRIEFRLKRTKESFLRRILMKVPESMSTLKIFNDLERLNRLPGNANATVNQTKTDNGKHFDLHD